MTPRDWDTARRRGQARAVQMGYARQETPEDDGQAPALEPLPTTNPRVLRALLTGNHLTPGQAEAARRLFRAVREYVDTDPHTPGDAA